MPQLDFSVFPSQAFWLLISFMLMWLIMAKMIVPKITDILNRRQRKIDDYLSAAAEFKQTAEDILEKYEQALHQANAQAAEYLRKAAEDLDKKTAEREEETSRRLVEMLAESEKKIEEDRRLTIDKIEKISIDLAARVAGKLGLDNVVSAEDVARTAKQEQKDE